jgi:hypothetical protein
MPFPKHPQNILITNEFYPDGLREIDNWNYYQRIKDKFLNEVFNRDLIVFLAINNRIFVLRKGRDTKYIRLNTSNFDNVFAPIMLSIHSTMKSIEDFGIIDIDTDDFKQAKEATLETYEYVSNKVPFIDSAWIKFSGKSSFHIICNFKNDMYTDRVKIMLENYLEDSSLSKNYTINKVIRGKKTVPNLDLAPMKRLGGYITLHSLSTLGLKCMKVPLEKVHSFKKEDAIIKTV